MVKVAFLVEGKVEKILVDYLIKEGWFSQFNIEQVGPTIDVKGGGNLCPQNMPVYVEQAKTYDPDKILILTDLECDPCVTKTKERLGDCDICAVVLAKKAVEAWFLADDELLSKLTNGNLTHYENPQETEDMPFDILKKLMIEHTGRGSGSKVMFAGKVKKHKFSVESVASHPNCDSTKYFIDKLKMIGEEN